jgi:Cu(I)/Ag(I) efflux system membrane fusion protein
MAPAAVVFALMVATMVAGCGRGERAQGTGAGGATARVGGYSLSVENRPKRPIVGDNTLVVAVRDSMGRPVEAANMRIVVTMPAMGAMPGMESRGVGRETRPGLYEVAYGIAMAGEWTLHLSVGKAGGESQAQFRLSTTTPKIEFLGSTAASAGEIPGTVTLDAARREAAGIRTEAVQVRALTVPIRAAGRVAYDETRRAEISLKFSGWVREIHIDYTGQLVRAGAPLLSVYSPELLTAQQEYLEARRSAPSGSAASGARDPELAASARQRLLLWDVAPEQIDEISRTGKPMDSVPILAPVSGVVVEKNVVQGSSFTAGQTLYKIAPVDPVWVVASVYQYELPLVREGMRASVIPSFQSEETRSGVVSYINPYLDPETHTGEVRVQIPNPRGDLKPGMFVDVSLERELGQRLAVPQSAVTFAGDRRVVFVDLGDGRLEPRDVTVGPKAGDYYEVVGGLKAGDVVVTSGNFLVTAESRLQSAGGR